MILEIYTKEKIEFKNRLGEDKMLTWNDVDMSQYFSVNDIRGRSVYTRNLDLISVTNMPGAYLQGITEPPRILEIDITIKAKNLKELRQKIDEINGIMISKEPVPLSFSDEPDKTYYGMSEAITEEIERDTVHKTTINVLCLDPYKYGPEKTVEPEFDTFNVENEGTAEAEPIIELTATQKATFAMIANGNDEYNLIGQPADDDVQVIDERTSVLYENGSTIDTWQHTTDRRFISNDINIDGLDGRMGTDGAGIRVEARATPTDKQNGPAIVKELPSAIQDFEIESTFDIISLREIENWRMMIYFLDENLNNIGHIGVKDNSRLYKRRVALSQLGEHNKGVSLIGDSDYIENNARDATLFYLRFKREGKKFSAYVAHWRNQKHDTVWQASYNDRNNRFQGRLKYITLFIGRYQDRVTPNRLRINSVEVFELSQVEEDQTPYIIYPGDVVEFDHVNKDILLNGESRKDLKAFGGSFFTLKKGINTLTVTPENTFNTKVTYRERYK